MKKHLLYAVFIGCLGMLLMYLLISVQLVIIHPLVSPIALISVVALMAAAVALKLSTGSNARVITAHVIQTVWLSTAITNLPILVMTGYSYYILSRTPQPYTVLRDSAEVAFSVFLLITGISFVLGIVLSLVARYFVNKRNSPTLPGALKPKRQFMLEQEISVMNMGRKQRKNKG